MARAGFHAEGRMPVLRSREPESCSGTVRAGGLLGFRELVSEMGGSPERLLRACGLAPGALDNPDDIITFSAGARLLHQAAKESGCPHFGLLLGQRQNLQLLGPVGFLMQHSPDVGTALASLIRYLHLHVSGASVALTVKGRLAEFSYSILLPDVIGSEQVYALCLANECRFLQLLCGKDWRPSAVHFCFRVPADPDPFSKIFGAPVHFNQPVSAVVFSSHYLQREISSANLELGQILRTYISQIESRYSGDFLGQLRSVVRTLLPTGGCTAERVAALFAMHRRTMHRQLAARQMTFESIVDSIRQEMAMSMLAQADISLASLARMLGYRNASSLQRAFRRWRGMTPTEWRARRDTA